MVWPLSNLLRLGNSPEVTLEAEDKILDISEMEDYELDTKQNPNTIVLKVHEKSTIIKDLDNTNCVPVEEIPTTLDTSRSSWGDARLPSRNRQTYYYRHNRNRNNKNERRRRHHQHTNVSQETQDHHHFPPIIQRRRRKPLTTFGSGNQMCANKNSSTPTAKLYAWKTSDWTECSPVNCFTWNTCKPFLSFFLLLRIQNK